MKEILDMLIYSLDQVEVHGKRNLDIMLGCIQTLEKLKSMVKTRVEEEKIEGGEAHDDCDKSGADV